jgi:dienelactone hydrolase
MNTRWLTLALVGTVTAGVWAAAEPVPVEARFTTADGVEIVGDYYAPAGAEPAPGIILLHMYHQDRHTWKPLIPKLVEAGFAVLAIDLRGHGESVRPAAQKLAQRAAERDSKLFNDMHQDVAAAYVWLAKQAHVDLAQFGLVGASVGCSVALDYAARDKSVDAVVCLTPGKAYLGVDSVAHIKAVGERPLLLLASEAERADSDALAKLNASTEVRVVGPGTVHGTAMFGQIEGIEQQITAFLQAHIRASGHKPVAAALGGAEYFAVGSAEDIKLDPQIRRLFSSVEEARARGLSGPDSPLNGKMIDTNEERSDTLPKPSRP